MKILEIALIVFYLLVFVAAMVATAYVPAHPIMGL